MEEYVIGLDYGTNSARAVIVNANTGEEIATHVYPYKMGEAGILLDHKRPQLAIALAEAKRSGAVLLIAKLDRLSRNVAFIANLLEGGVEIVAADNPNANRMMLQMYSVFAEEEGRAISERTKAALAAAKARGVKLGWSMPSRAGQQQEAAQKGVAQIKASADQFAANIMPVIGQIKATGTTSLRGVANELNQRGLKTSRGGAWYAGTVKNVLARG